MKITPVKTPVVAKKMFPNYVWDKATTNKELYLTFDDGPTPEITQWTLEILEKYNAKATFFCIGKNVEKHPEIFQEIIDSGHAIGNHTYNHLKGWKTLHRDYIADIEKATKNIKTSLFRPPYGKLTPKQGKTLIAKGFNIVMWDVLSMDWDKSISPESCLEKVLTKSSLGSIIVFHDSMKAAKNMKYALPKVLEHFSKKGFSFKKLEF